ncbi:APC family permease [Ruicaihuangia caeni]|uniref:APC family permease n=1 Tax=Ruicaihuangia caeni TaxID=3042517 RepID=A0AAW6T9L6_9MICO|nr:APC family permease [Klugiella sp. YN-L-19]MDI2099049.1 APC family permease [Klugiella sp. YN-L-19]
MTPPPLLRRLRLGDAVFIGLGSMIGAGVFAAFAPAAAAAGNWLLLGLAIAAFVAYCNATSSAQLAAQFPTSGGTYAYGRAMLGDWWGFVAGWGFVVGKIASCAAMALTFAAYAVPPEWQKPVAALAVAALVTVNLFGVTRTALATRVIVTVVLVALAIAVAATTTVNSASATWAPGQWALPDAGLYGILQSAALLFFAFAGYARIATMGEEVIDPAKTIPRAISISLGAVIVIYAAVGISVLATLGPAATAGSTRPLADAVAAADWPWASVVVRVGAAAASLGALLALIAGIGRTSLAMAREHDLPAWLAAVHPRWHVPHRAELVVGAIVVVLVLATDLRGAIAFSSFGVLVYYSIANISAWRQVGAARRYPRWLQLAGAAGCGILVLTLPPLGVLTGVAVFIVGLAYRAIRLRAAAR